MDPRPTLMTSILVGVSGAFHLGVWFVLGLLPPIDALVSEDILSVEVIEEEPEEEILPPPPEEEPEPEVEEPEPEPEPERPEPRVQRAVPVPEQPVPEEAPPPPPEFEEFEGMVLENPDATSDVTVAAANGQDRDGPVAVPHGNVTGRRRAGVEGGIEGGTGTRGGGEEFVAAGNLSRQPGPPNSRLRRLLERNYPRSLQERGEEGYAVVAVRVDSEGNVRPTRVDSETHNGFGQACQLTIRQGGRWEPPRDRNGRQVASEVLFRCDFTIHF